jgi:RloB-like protein
LSQPTRPTRRQSATPPKRRILVFTEGEVTETIYLTHVHRQHRERITVVIDDRHGAPLTLVRHAADERRRWTREERRGRGAGFDEYWCVLDVDEHPNLDEALDMARASGISVALSNPCIELWFVLHSADQSAFIDRYAAQSRNRELHGFDKRPTVAALNQFVVRYTAAKKRAVALDEMHRRNDSPERSNPSTSIPPLIDTIVA